MKKTIESILYFSALTTYKLEQAIDNSYFDKSKLNLPYFNSSKEILYYTAAPKEVISAIKNRESIFQFYIKNYDWGLEVYNNKYYHNEYKKYTDNLFFPIFPAQFAIYMIENQGISGDPAIIVFTKSELDKHQKVDYKSITPSIIKINNVLAIENIKYFDEHNFEIKARDISKYYLN